jgi:hypothetical protein
VTVYNWAKPRDLSHYETFEHYHETFYKHVEALSVTPFSDRALDRGLTGVLVSLVRLFEARLNANEGAGELQDSDPTMPEIIDRIVARAELAMDDAVVGGKVRDMLVKRRDEWLARVHKQTDHRLGYRGDKDAVVGLLQEAEPGSWDMWTCLNSLRDVEGTVNLLLDQNHAGLQSNP